MYFSIWLQVTLGTLMVKSARSASRRKPPRSLCVLLQALVGRSVTIELRSRALVSGVLSEVDGKMNTIMSEVTVTMRDMPVASYPSLHVSGRHVVFVHLPEMLCVATTIRQHVESKIRTT